DGADRTHDRSRLDGFRADTAALDFVEAHFDGLAVVLFLALIDRDVIHPHPVLLRDRRSVGQSHWVAVVQNFAEAGRRWGRLLRTGLERDFLVLIDRKVVAALGILLRFGRPIRRAARIAVVEDLAFGLMSIRVWTMTASVTGLPVGLCLSRTDTTTSSPFLTSAFTGSNT